jgi:DNA-binding transcriptional ArsR family regulator
VNAPLLSENAGTSVLPHVEVIHDTVRAESLLHPVRLRLLGELIKPESAAGLARRLGLPRQIVNYHVRHLEADGLVRVVAERRKRNCIERVVQATARAYVIAPAALGPLALNPDAVGDRFSPASLLAMAGRIVRDVGELQREADHTRQRLATLTVETEVHFASQRDQQTFVAELTDVVADLVAKYNQPAIAGGPRSAFVVAGYPNPRRPSVSAAPSSLADD